MKVWSLDYVNRHYFPQHFKLLCLSSWNVRSVEEELLGNAIRIVKVFWCLLTMLEPMVILILTVPLRILQCFAASLSLWGRWPWPLLGCFAQRRENEKTTTHKTKKNSIFPPSLAAPGICWRVPGYSMYFASSFDQDWLAWFQRHRNLIWIILNPCTEAHEAFHGELECAAILSGWLFRQPWAQKSLSTCPIAFASSWSIDEACVCSGLLEVSRLAQNHIFSSFVF